jgi:ATP-dependent RNA helicase DDX24/MAK5
MAPESKKRKASALNAKHSNRPNLKKRQNHDATAKSSKPASNTAAHFVPHTRLQWKPITVPDALEDYEGFFGLEEVDDVEVVREGDVISFKTHQEAPQTQKENGLNVSLAAELEEFDDEKEQSDDATSDGASDAESWGGFSDEEEVASAPISDTAVPKQNGESTQQKLKKESKKRKKFQEVEADQELEGAQFAELQEDGKEEEVGVDASAWSDLNLSAETLSSLSQLKFATPTPIQKSAIPHIIVGHDAVCKAATGSGKTLAYGIPILEHFLVNKDQSVEVDKEDHVPIALILSPTRELAVQISAHLTALNTKGSFEGPRTAIITGGLSIQKQQRQLATADIIVGTPGRLWEVISTSHNLIDKLKRIKFLVVDEADRLLSEGHFKEVEEILTTLDRTEDDEEGNRKENESKRDRQVLVFSATFQKDLQRKLTSRNRGVVNDLMSNRESLDYLLTKLPFRSQKPKFIDVDPVTQMAPNLREALIQCPDALEKDLYLYALLLLHPRTRTLIFTNSIAAVRRLTPYLQNLNLPAQTLHSNMIQKARLRAIERFTKSESSILISTDVAARGLDIPGVELVVHYHLPRAADAYVHRSGRTARAGNKGGSVLLCAPGEAQGMRRLIAKVHSDHGKKQSALKLLDIDRRVVSRIKPRSALAKRIADVNNAKQKANSDDKLFREAAEELGVDYDSEELDAMDSGRRGRGNARKKKERVDRDVSKKEVAAWKAELKHMLSLRVNVGVSERYLTAGGVDIDALLDGGKGEFLGETMALDW